MDGMNRLADAIDSRIAYVSNGARPLSLASVDSALDAVTDDSITLPQAALTVCRPLAADAQLQADDRLLICWLDGEPILLGRLDPID